MHHMTKVPPGSCSPFETPKDVPQFSFLLASSHHHPSMNYYYIFLLLLVVLSAYSESPQHANPPDSPPIGVTVYPDSSSAKLGILAPVLPQNEVYKFVLPQNEVFESVTVSCQLSNRVKTIMISALNLGVKGFNHMTSTLIHGGEKLGWAIRILLECLQHVLKMYTWFLSENQASVHFRCKLTALLLKKSLFRKHDFAACVHRLYHCYQNLCFQHLQIFSAYIGMASMHKSEKNIPIYQTNFISMV